MNTIDEKIDTIAELKIKPVLMLVRIDESRGFRDSDAGKALLAKCGKIYGVYLYNENLHTHLCSLFPSYWLEYIGFSTETPYSDDATVYEAIDDELTQSYAQEDSSGYHDVLDIDRIPLGANKQIAVWNGDETDTYDEYLESAREYFQGNPPW